MISRKRMIWFLGILAAALLFLASFQDEAFAAAFYDPDSMVAALSGAFAMFPVYWGLLIVCLIQLRKIALVELYHPIYWLVLTVLVTVWVTGQTVSQIRAVFPEWPVLVPGLLLLYLPALWFYLQIKNASSRKLEKAQYLLLILSVLSAVLVWLLARLWIRPAYWVTVSYAQIPFVDWWKMHSTVKGTFMNAFGISAQGFLSFPDPASASAAVLLGLTVLPKLNPVWRRRSVLLWIFILVWIIWIGWGRMSAGEACLSDEAAGFLCTYYIYIASWRRLYRPPRKK